MDEKLFHAGRSYRPDEIAQKLAVDICTVYRMIRDIDDPLPAFRLRGRVLRVEGRELIQYLERRKVNPADE